MKPTKTKPGEHEYYFGVNVTITLGVTVHAPNLAAAVKKAQRASVMSLCHQCAHTDLGVWGTTGELDTGNPCEEPLVDVYSDDPEVTEEAAQGLWNNQGESK